MDFSRILSRTESYYSEKIRAHGTSARGVDWNSTESQELRFRQLLQICDSSSPFVINDYGCGYGALVDCMQRLGFPFRYCGFDISAEMIARAKERYASHEHVQFVVDATQLPVADYTVASGIFNVKQDVPNGEWHSYVLHVLDEIDRLSSRGFAFNVLTAYSDADRMRPDLYYADPLKLFAHCKRRYSRFVALLHDYPLYEFTILVRK